ncbi:MAG: AMP-binding protein [Ilumatobacteraceae bacterium]
MRLDRLSSSSAEVSTFRWELPSTFNFATDVVDDWAARRPDLDALVWLGTDGTEQRHTYRDIARSTGALAAQFAVRGIAAGDRVIVMLPRIPAWQQSMVALLRIGAVPIPCITMLTAHDLAYRIEHSGATAVVTDAANGSKFAGIADGLLRFSADTTPGFETLQPDGVLEVPAATVAIDDPAILYYTSGSTGMPKGVLHTASSLYSWRGSAEHWLSLDEGDVMWCTADTGWSKAGTSILFGPWSRGATVVFHDGPFLPHRRFEILEQQRVVCFCAAATELRRLVQEFDASADLSHLALTVSAGEALDPDTVVRWGELAGCVVLDGYGQTETLMTVTNAAGMTVKPGSMGRPLPGIDVAVFDTDGVVHLGAGHGELLIGADNPQLMAGYYHESDRTERCFLRDPDGLRWFRTGDLVDVDADGYISYAGRTDDIINSSGYRIGPQEVENALMTHPAVLEAAVVGLPDAARGEIVTAMVILTPDGRASAELDRAGLVASLQEHTRNYTAPYKYPRDIRFVDELPKTATGKIRRVALRDDPPS